MTNAFEYAKVHGAVPLINDPYEGKYNPEDLCYNDYKYSSYNKKFVSEVKEAIGCDELKAAVAK
jgi:hypothetical protein